MPCVQDIVNIMEELAPSQLAETWDSAGLQVGKQDWPVRSVWVALDPLPEVVEAACDQHVDMLITHHPLLFQPLKQLDFNSPVGAILYQSAVHRLSIYAAHTNLDKATGGVNDMLARRIGLEDVSVLMPEKPDDTFKLVLYVPADYEHPVLNALFETPAGLIGDYTRCTFRNPGKGTFLPGQGARPFTGKPGEISHVEEIRIETRVVRKDLPAVLSHVRRHHPYETMAYDIYPMMPEPGGQGFGRIGRLREPVKLGRFAEILKETLRLQFLRLTGNPEMNVRQAAVCSGSGSSLLSAFWNSSADVYISGDLRYHDARTAETAGKALIDIGHFSSEHLVIEPVRDYLRRRLADADEPVRVEAYELEKDPFVML